MWQKIKQLVDERIIRHFRESRHPVEELALGSFLGILIALTPLVGAQMTIVTVLWFALRLIRVRFHMAIAMAWVWVSNPFTMPILYYSFYIVGYYSFRLVGIEIEMIEWAAFKASLEHAFSMGPWDGSINLLEYLLLDLGWPMMIGGLVMGIPIAIASYPITIRSVNKLRERKAHKLGLTLQEWEEKYVRTYDRDEDTLEESDFTPYSVMELDRNQSAAEFFDESDSNRTTSQRRTKSSAGGSRRKKTARGAGNTKKKTGQTRGVKSRDNRSDRKSRPATAMN